MKGKNITEIHQSTRHYCQTDKKKTERHKCPITLKHEPYVVSDHEGYGYSTIIQIRYKIILKLHTKTPMQVKQWER